MNRPFNKQRKFRTTVKHRLALNARYNPPAFSLKRQPVYYSKDSTFGYMMAKGIYWNERYREPVLCEYSGIVFRGEV